MKNYLITLFLLFSMTVGSFAQSEGDSHWDTQPGKELTLNYNLFGKGVSQGVWYGTGGYAAGMLISGNKIGWGIVGSVLAVNVPVLFQSELQNPETIIGRNLGSAVINVGFSLAIDLHRRGKPTYKIMPILRKHN